MVDIVQDKDNYQENKERRNVKYNIIIVGAGGFGREVYLWAKKSFSTNHYKIKGFLDDNPRILDIYNMDVGVVGNLDNYKIENQDRFLFAIGDIDIKKRLIIKMKKRGAKFLTLIHPTAIVADTAKIGEGVVICPFCLVSDNVRLDDFVMMNAYSSCGHDGRIGKYCILSSYTAIAGFALLEDEVFLGLHATVVPGKRVGYKSKVSANSVVMRDVPANKIVFGVPGKAI
ncbi:MAG TPA: acetyltransferase [Atribacterota bacterium]|nr:acetyltransferase [Atribacterota bacterium]